MSRILFRIDVVEIRSYGLMITLAFVVWMFLSMSRAKKRGIRPDHIVHLSLIIFLSAAIGARLLFIATHADNLRRFWHELLRTFTLIAVGVKGISMVGGVLLALISIVLYCYFHKIPLLRLFDAMAPPFGVGLFLSRIGCFLNGCCFGKPCDLPWCMKFPTDSPAGMRFPDIAIHPTQLYAALAGLLIALILFLLDRKPRFDGFLFSLLGILFGIDRLLIDPFKYVSLQEGGTPLSVNQILSLSIIGLTTALYIGLKRRDLRKNGKQ